MNGALYVSDSGNTKLMGSQKVDATYVSIEASCPKSCPLKDESCYAQLSFTGMTTNRLDSESEGISALQAARAEAKAIDESYHGKSVPEGRALRIHVAGDSRTITGTKLINNAIKRWKKRGGGDVWSYTHAWRNVPRSAWNQVSILASISSVKEAEEAKKQGYAPAIVVSDHLSDKAYNLEGSDIKWIPCPSQTNPGGKEIGCTDCKLCFNANRLLEGNFGIAFAAHGSKKNNIKRRLSVLQ